MSTRTFCDNCDKRLDFDSRNSKSFGVSPSTNSLRATKFKAYVAIGRHDTDGYRADLCGECFKTIVRQMVRP